MRERLIDIRSLERVVVPYFRLINSSVGEKKDRLERRGMSRFNLTMFETVLAFDGFEIKIHPDLYYAEDTPLLKADGVDFEGELPVPVSTYIHSLDDRSGPLALQTMLRLVSAVSSLSPVGIIHFVSPLRNSVRRQFAGSYYKPDYTGRNYYFMYPRPLITRDFESGIFDEVRADLLESVKVIEQRAGPRWMLPSGMAHRT